MINAICRRPRGGCRTCRCRQSMQQSVHVLAVTRPGCQARLLAAISALSYKLGTCSGRLQSIMRVATACAALQPCNSCVPAWCAVTGACCWRAVCSLCSPAAMLQLWPGLLCCDWCLLLACSVQHIPPPVAPAADGATQSAPKPNQPVAGGGWAPAVLCLLWSKFAPCCLPFAAQTTTLPISSLKSPLRSCCRCDGGGSSEPHCWLQAHHHQPSDGAWS